MIAMKQYIVKRGGVELTMQLSDEDAKRMNARPVPAKAKAPGVDSPADDAEKKAEAEAAAEAKAKAPDNKSRAPQNK